MDEKDNYLVRYWIGLDTDHDGRPLPKTGVPVPESS